MLVFKKASITSDITLALTKVLLRQGHVKIIRARTFWGPFINDVMQVGGRGVITLVTLNESVGETQCKSGKHAGDDCSHF